MPTVMAAIFRCFVGCGTDGLESPSLHVLECDAETGAAKIVQSVPGVGGTTYFQVSPDGRWLYSVVSELRDGKKRSCAVRFQVGPEGTLGACERIAQIPAEAPCHVALSPDGKRLFTASYVSATVASIATDGSDIKTYVFPDDDMGPNAKRQKKAYAHFVFLTPDSRRLGAIDLGCDRIRFFDPLTLSVDESLEIKTSRGDGPRHAVWSKDGRFLYVVNELGSSVTAYRFRGDGFERIGRWSALPETFNRFDSDGLTLASKAAAIKMTEDGSILMASNRGCDSIAFFAVDGGTGLLELRSIAPLKGRFPRDFELVPGEKFMVVGHKMSDEIQIYRFDRAACTISAEGAPIPCKRPLCFKFARTKP